MRHTPKTRYILASFYDIYLGWNGGLNKRRCLGLEGFDVPRNRHKFNGQSLHFLGSLTPDFRINICWRRAGNAAATTSTTTGWCRLRWGRLIYCWRWRRGWVLGAQLGQVFLAIYFKWLYFIQDFFGFGRIRVLIFCNIYIFVFREIKQEMRIALQMVHRNWRKGKVKKIEAVWSYAEGK